MKFGEIPVAQAAGAILAHSMRERGIAFRKGRALTPEDIGALAAAGLASVTAVRLEPGDLDENAAASRIGEAIGRAGLAVNAPGAGRCNLSAMSRSSIKMTCSTRSARLGASSMSTRA